MKLIPAEKMPSAYRNMFNIYAHELSQYNPWLGTQIDKNGNYILKIVQDQINGGNAFVITENAIPCGLAVLSSYEEGSDSFHDVEEIFVVRTSRGKGICEKICTDFWKKNSGTGILYVLRKNLPAIEYWERLLKKSGYTYSKINENEQMLLYKFKLIT